MVAFELGDVEDKDPVPYIAAKDLPKVTPTKCSTICSSSDTKPDLTVVAPVTCTTLAVSSMVLLASDGTTGNTNIDAPVCFKETHAMCSMVGLDVNGGNDQAVVAFQTKTVVSKDVSASVHPMGNLATRLFVDKMMVQCELQPVPCETFNSYDTRVHILQPWPPTIKVSWLALIFIEIGVAHTDMMDKVLHWADLKPWPPPSGNGSVHFLISAHASVELQELDLAEAREGELLSVVDLWFVEMWHSGYAILNENYEDYNLLQLLLCKKWLKLVLCEMCCRRYELKLPIGCDPKQYIVDLILELEGTLEALGDYCFLCQGVWSEFIVGNNLDFLKQLELTSDKLVQVTSNLVRTCYMQKLGTGEEHILKFKYACNGWPTRKFRKMPKNDCNGHWKMSRLFVNLHYFSFGLSTAKTVQKGSCYLRGSDKVLLTKLEMQSCVNLGDDNVSCHTMAPGEGMDFCELKVLEVTSDGCPIFWILVLAATEWKVGNYTILTEGTYTKMAVCSEQKLQCDALKRNQTGAKHVIQRNTFVAPGNLAYSVTNNYLPEGNKHRTMATRVNVFGHGIHSTENQGFYSEGIQVHSSVQKIPALVLNRELSMDFSKDIAAPMKYALQVSESFELNRSKKVHDLFHFDDGLLSSSQELEHPWDPGGLLHRLGDKTIFKERGLLGPDGLWLDRYNNPPIQPKKAQLERQQKQQQQEGWGHRLITWTWWS
jgi:hypothetical protein